MLLQDALIDGAIEAAISTARRLRIRCTDPVLLHRSQHASVHLRPSSIVARVRSAADEETLRRELAVAQHLKRKGAPVVGPAEECPAGPHLHGAFGLTLWQFVEHVAADFDNREHMLRAGTALRRVHAALADVPENLPPFWRKVDDCRHLLDDRAALPVLAADDRAFLIAVHDRVRAAVSARPLSCVAIHGDAGAHNVFITAAGALYTDFEDVCLGPREWDIGYLGDVDLALFEPVDRALFWLLSDLRSVCVAVWCFQQYAWPEKREAAEYHLGYLKEKSA